MLTVMESVLLSTGRLDMCADCEGVILSTGRLDMCADCEGVILSIKICAFI